MTMPACASPSLEDYYLSPSVCLPTAEAELQSSAASLSHYSISTTSFYTTTSEPSNHSHFPTYFVIKNNLITHTHKPIPSILNKGNVLIITYMRSLREKINQNTQKTTTEDEAKRYTLFKKLTSQTIDHFRDTNIQEYDLNITESIEQLQQIDNYITPLIYTAYYGLKDIMKLLLTNRVVDVDLQTDSNKQTPLTTACLMANYQIVRMLLLAKAEVNKPNILNQTPLTIILFRLVEQPSSFENKKICFLIADLLIKYGADLNWIIDKKNGYSILHYFCSIKIKMNESQKLLNYQIISYLLQKGANSTLLTLEDKSCEHLVQNHSNREELIPLFQQYRVKSPSRKEEPKPYKKIDANFFKI